MSGLEALLPLIYHEKQQPGSQLCAQHALNVILQGDFFSAPDLAQFAQQLDALEGSFNEDAGPVSNNMDDTGFFSVQVLERALRVWGFTIVRWRSQDLRDQQDSPHAQMAFLLNHQQHWFALRRFGSSEDPDGGHWFNLNSFLEQPEWVGKLYLGMVLSQAEDEGYSVFAVLPTHETPDGPTKLPHTQADEVASTLPQPTSSNTGVRLFTSNIHASSPDRPAHTSGFEDEDLELQVALQASLTGGEGQMEYAALATSRPHAPSMPGVLSGTRLDMPPSRPVESADGPLLGQPEFHDPVAASMARNKAIMQRMLREQEMALREGYEEEVAFHFGGPNGADEASRRSGESSRSHQTPRTQNVSESEEQEAIRRAIEESQRDGGETDSTDIPEGCPMPGHFSLSDNNYGDPRERSSSPPGASPSFVGVGDRVYDDEDAELQAALKASLEGIPEGFYIPPTPRAVRTNVEPVLRSTEQSAAVATEGDGEGDEGELKATEEIDAEEMRRRRLARFGGQP